VGVWVFIAIVIAVLAYWRSIRQERLTREHAQTLALLRQDLDNLRAWLAGAQAAQQAAQQSAQATRAAAAPAASASAEPSTSAHVAAAATAEAAAMTSTADTVSAHAPDQTVDLRGAAATSVPAAAFGAGATTGATAGASASGTPAAFPPPPAYGPAAAAATASAGASTSRGAQAGDLEDQIGSRWLLYIGIAAVLLGVSYFVKYAFDNEWINPPMRVLLGLLTGSALVAGGQRFVTRGYAAYGQALSGGGLGILYISIFTAHRWYDLIGRPAAFVAMVIVTALAAVLADRQRSQALALLAVTAGFVTPFLVGGDGNAQISLFTYDLILVCGTLYLARRREWPALNLVSYIATLLTISAWMAVHYRSSLYLVTEIFITTFFVLFLYVWRENQRSRSAIATLTGGALLLSPPLYHLASLGILGPHVGALLVYLIGVTVAGVIIANQKNWPWLRALVWLAIALPFVEFGTDRPSGWLVGVWVTLIALYGVHLFAQITEIAEDRTRLSPAEIFLIHANGLWLWSMSSDLLAWRGLEWSAMFAVIYAGWYAALAVAARTWHREAALHAIALASALFAIACAQRFDGPALIVAYAAEGAALIWLGLRTERWWLRLWGGALLVIGVSQSLDVLGDAAPVSYWPIVNPRTLACAFVVALLFWLASLHKKQEAQSQAAGSIRATLIVCANLLTLIILSAEITAYFGVREWHDSLTGGVEGFGAEGSNAELARQLSLSIVWAAYGVLLIAIGIVRDYRPLRYLAMLLLGGTILKVFFIDLATLGRFYRMLSVTGLGILLLVASYLYQRLRRENAAPPEAAPDPHPGPEPPPSPAPTSTTLEG